MYSALKFNKLIKLSLFPLLVAVVLFLPLQSVFAANGEVVNSSELSTPQRMDYITQSEFHALYCLLVGQDPITNEQCVQSVGNGKFLLYDQRPNSIWDGLTKGIGLVYANPPVSTKEYLAQEGWDLGLFTTPAYADPGKGILNPVVKLWEVMRNLTYVAFILVFLAVGFMIMFRQKINPQTVVTVQSALPGLVIGLILVYFSYFISALIVDLAFIGIPLVGKIFETAGANYFTTQDFSDNSNIFLFGIKFLLNGNILNVAINPLITTIKDSLNNLMGVQQPTNVLQSVLNLASTAIGIVIGAFFGALITFVLFVAVIIQVGRTFIELIKAYITIMVTTILSPFIILFSSLPGKRGTLSSWWKTLLANVLIFPAVFAAFLFGGMFLNPANSKAFELTMPLISGVSTALLSTIVGVGVILGTPAIPKMVKDALGVKDSPAMGALTGAAIAGAAAGYGSSRLAGAYGGRAAARGLVAANRARMENGGWRGAAGAGLRSVGNRYNPMTGTGRRNLFRDVGAVGLTAATGGAALIPIAAGAAAVEGIRRGGGAAVRMARNGEDPNWNKADEYSQSPARPPKRQG